MVAILFAILFLYTPSANLMVVIPLLIIYTNSFLQNFRVVDFLEPPGAVVRYSDRNLIATILTQMVKPFG